MSPSTTASSEQNSSAADVSSAGMESLIRTSACRSERGDEVPGASQRRQQLVSPLPDGHNPQRDVRHAGVGEGPQALLDRRLAARGEDVADLAGVTMLEQLL